MGGVEGCLAEQLLETWAEAASWLARPSKTSATPVNLETRKQPDHTNLCSLWLATTPPPGWLWWSQSRPAG